MSSFEPPGLRQARPAVASTLAVAILLLAAAASQAQAESPSSPWTALTGKVLAGVEVRGLARTKPHVVMRELRLLPGGPIEAEAIEEGLQRLRNLQIFDSVVGLARQERDGGITLVIDVSERWTILPFVRASGGGGTTSVILGLYDINVTGRYLELGGQYENLSGAHSGVVWARQPRLFGRFLRLGGDFWLTLRNRDLMTFDGAITGAFSIRRNRFHLFGDAELHRYLAIGGRVDALWDELSETALSPGRREINRNAGFVPSDRSRQIFLGAFVRLGRLDFDSFLVGGKEARVEIDHARPLWGADQSFWRMAVTGLAFWRPLARANLGLQARAGHVGSDALPFVHYLGGFDSIRGFADGQFRGRTFWHANLEFRVPSFATRALVLQHVVFSDVGRAGDGVKKVFGHEARTAASAGTGIRLLSPKVYRLGIRLDLAYALAPRTGLAISFGTQQFF